MSKEFRKFPSIVAFSAVVKHIRDNAKFYGHSLPTITFSGSVKVHGTNGCVGYDGVNIWAQSRERILSYESDNAGFATWVLKNTDEWVQVFKLLGLQSGYIYGEWCGPGIHKGVAVNKLTEKKFGIFEVIDENNKVCKLSDSDAVTINTLISSAVVIDHVVPPLSIEIDFAVPESAQNKLLDYTLQYEKECPFGKYFGESGVGEGIVWSPVNYDYECPKIKVKGEAHSVTKVTTVKELSAAEIASKENAVAFVEYACTEVRMMQGISKLEEMGLSVEMKNMGAYLKWLGNDILTECVDVLVKSSIERKDVMPKVADKGRAYFINYLNCFQ